MEKKLHCGDLFKRVLSLAMALVMLLSFAPVPHAHAADATYIVAGVEGLCGTNWNPTDVNNQMTLVDGLYTKTFADVPAGESYQFKVVENLSDGTQNWIGKGDNNITFNVLSTCDVTVTFDASTKEITVSGSNVELPDGLKIEGVYAVGNGDGTWLNGVNWDPADDANRMTEISDGVYEITFEDVEVFDNYQVKFVTNGSWADNWGGVYIGSGVVSDAVYNSSDNITIEVPYELADVTLKLDLTKFNYDTKSGAKFTVTVVDANAQPEPDEPVVENTYIIAGSTGLCGSDWDPADTANKMSLVDGKYTKTYSNVAKGSYSFKVTDGSWSNSWGKDGGEQNFAFNVTAACDVTITFNESTKAITVTGGNVEIPTELKVDAMRAVGNGSGNWLNGASWNVAASANTMTETSKGVYEITYNGVPKGNAYEVKFAANGSWSDNWGGTFVKSGAATNAVFNSSANIKFAVPYDAADVTLKLDLTGFDYGTKNGAKFTVTITKVEVEPTVDYYLVGYINGADCYGTDYKFVNGKVDASFTADSYVFVQDSNGKSYMTDGWQGEVTSATLYDVDTIVENTPDKLKVPANTEVVFTLVENEDGPLTLSYAPAVEGTKVTIHFLKPETWGSTINGYVWLTDGTELFGVWPGKAVAENADHAGWYDLVAVTEEPTAFNFIFNDGSSQTGDLSTGPITGSTELWVVGTKPTDVKTEEPDEWKGIFSYTADIHFHNTAEWETVNVKFGQGDNWNPIEGYEAYKNNEFGVAMEENPHNSGWHTVSVTVKGSDAAINGLFNNGSWGDGNQMGNWSTGTLTGKQEFWYDNGVLSTTRPSGWFDPNRTVHVPGTFPGPSWDAASNQMTYDPDLGLYVYTFEDVPPANYEFKIAINGAWDPENYGAGGALKGANIPVAVPETMDVTVYYNDKTHYAVTSVSYKFVEVSVSGTGIETTALTDEGLTGIYSGTVAMAKGIYTDVVITCDGKEYKFNEIEVKEDKNVTFYIDPVTGIFYCDASGIPVKTEEIYFNSQDEAYKAPFGAVAAGEDISFSIKTGVDVTSAVLVIKGLASYPMEKNEETGLWSCTASVANIGEYDYYFVVSNGSAVAIYGDDDGYYGEGTVTDLVSVMPYDLVVHKADFKTPVWMKNAVIYQIFPDRFFDGDESNNRAQTWARGTVNYEYITDWYTLPENPEQMAKLDKATYKSTGAWYGDGEWSNEIYGGDLEGITQRIGYLKALGVNVIYLNPVFWSISNHRYDAVDYTKIDPILGTLGDFKELVRVAEANGMHIILDGVFNHVSDDSVYFDRYYKFLGKSEKIGAYPYWAYVYDYMKEKGADQGEAEAAAKAYFSEEYGITDYSYTAWFEVSSTKNENGVYSYQGWWGYDSMPVIKSTNGSEYQTGNWAKEIISGKNSVNAYWITKGMDGWRLDVANEVSDETWQNFRDSVKALNSDAVIIGEIWDDATKYLKGDMYDSVMNYLFRNAVTGFAMGTSAVDTTKLMEKIRERYPEEAFYAMMNLVGSHDTTRILSYLDGIGDDRADKSMAAAFPTYATTTDLAKQRQYLVSFLQFTYAGAPTIYYGDEIGMVGADDPDDRRAFEWGKGNKELVEWYAKLAAIREAYPALRTGSVQPIDTKNTNVMGYVRADDANTLTVLANNDTEDQTVELDGTYVDLISGDPFDGTVPALNGVILVAEDEVKTVDIDEDGLAPAYYSAYIVPERSATPHVHDCTKQVVADEYLATAADCENAATYYYSCECGKKGTETFTDGEKLGHAWGDGEITTEPDCENTGVRTYTCERGCTKTETVDALNHAWDDGEITTEPDCENAGVRTYTCERGCTKTEEVEKLGHNYKDGACTRCGEDDPNSVPATPVKPAKPNWKNWLDKIFGNWWGDKDEKPQEPTEPEKPSEPENEPSEPEKPTEPEQTVPSKPITPAKPIWSNIIKKIFGWWKK